MKSVKYFFPFLLTGIIINLNAYTEQPTQNNTSEKQDSAVPAFDWNEMPPTFTDQAGMTWTTFVDKNGDTWGVNTFGDFVKLKEKDREQAPAKK